MVLTFVLIGIFLIGVTKAYAPSTDEAPAPEPIPLDGPDEATPEAVEPAAATDLAGVG